MEIRGKAYRRWKTVIKYISRLKKRYYYWNIKDKNAPKGCRKAKTWKEIYNVKEAKLYKKTVTKYSSKWDFWNKHLKIKASRKEGKKIINNELIKD